MKAPSYFLAVVAALAVVPVLSTGRDAAPNEVIAAGGSNYVCVVNLVSETPGQFCTYNAVRCPGMRTSLDHVNCQLKTGDCNNAAMDPNCFDVPGQVIEDSYGDYVDKNLATKGLSQQLPDDFQPKPVNDTKILSNELAVINTGMGKIRVRIFLLRTLDKNKKFFQIIGQGVEVKKSAKEPDLEIANDPKVVHFKGKVCFLNLGSTKYTVILNTKVGK